MAFKQALEFAVDVVDKASAKFKQIGDSASKNLGDVETKTKGIGGAFENAAARSPLLTGALDKVGLSGAQAGSMIQAALPGAMLVAGGAVAAFGVKAFSTFQDLGQSVLDFQRIVGGTAEESSAFVAVLDDYEISAEAGAAAIGKMAKVAANTPASFEKFGIEIAKNADGTTNLQATLLNAAEAYADTNDSATKAALGAALFGKGYATLIPILEKGADGADGLAEAFANVEGQQILSQDQIDQAESTRLALDELGDSAGELTIALGSALSPAVEKAAGLLGLFAEGVNTASGFLKTETELTVGSGQAIRNWIGEHSGLEAVTKSWSAQEAVLTDFTVASYVASAAQEKLTGSTNAVEQALGLQATTAANNEGALLANKIATEGKSAADEVAKEKADALTTALDAQRAAADALYNSINSLISSDLAYRNSVDATEDAVGTFREALAAATGENLLNAEANEVLDDATRGAEAAIIAEAAAAVQAAEDNVGFGEAALTAAEKARVQRDALEELKNKFPELAGVIQGHIDKLNAIPDRKTTFVDTIFTEQGHAPGGGRAIGGTVEPGQPRQAATGVTFLHVGEQGPEDVALFGNGRVLNRADTMEAAANGGRQGAGSVVIQNANFYDAVDVDLFARRVTFAMAIV